MSGSNPFAAAIAAGSQQPNALTIANSAVALARQGQDLHQQQFALQQAQLQPAYQSMRQLMATNPDPSWDDVRTSLAQSARIGANVDGLVANANEVMAQGGKPADFMRATALGGMSAERQGELVGPQRQSISTGAGTIYGTTPGIWGPNAGQFNPAGFIARGLTPAEATDMIQVGVNPDGSPIMKPRGAAFGEPYGGAPAGSPPSTGGAGGGGGGPAGPPPGSPAQSGQPLSQMDADLANFAQRESGNQNIFSRVQVPGYTQQQTGSGYYQIIPS
ncbi:MAG TPA: hypothetical protein VGH84_00625, partial [Steroidobacteraceae bacterium]